MMQGWKCRLLMFSGRPDPVWRPCEDPVRELLDYCNEAPPGPAPASATLPPLGYHGAELFNDEQTITAFENRIEIKTPHSTVVKTDPGRKFEQMVLSTAPGKFKSLTTGLF